MRAALRGPACRFLQMAAKSRRLARNSKLGDDDTVTSLAIHTAASASDCDDGRQPIKGNETEMSHAPGVQADSTAERRGAAVSFATKEEAIAYIVSHAPRDIPAVEGGDSAASQLTHSTAD